jgi:hypothetical protein
VEADDDLDVYPCLVDDAPASIYVNRKFEHAPPATHDTRYTIAILMREAGEDGIGTAAETAALDLVEEDLMVCAYTLGLLYVGRLRTRGTWEITFYGPRGRLDPLRRRAADGALDRRVAAMMKPEPAWTYYRELLLPDAERRQWMDDRRMVRSLREQGDRLSAPRRVDHRLVFPDAAARDAFLVPAVAAGFTVDHDELSVRAHRLDPIELDHIHGVVMILVDAATPLGGRYERWEAGIVT